MIIIEVIDDKLVRLTSSEAGGLIKEKMNERTHREVICSNKIVNNFVEVVPNEE